MMVLCETRNLVTRTYLVGILYGLSGFGSGAAAQNAAAPAGRPPGSIAAPAAAGASSMANEKLRQHVQAALHADPYFYDEHVTVSVEKNDVVLQGFVSSAWDLQDAIRIAGKAAGNRRVIDDLSIELGGNK